jgi:alpha-beta hydrolase superfamily lysophospholipase
MNAKDIFDVLDHPWVNAAVFFPRPDPGRRPPEGSVDLRVSVAPNTALSVRLHPAAPANPTILHFHGNGEIVADYDDLAEVYRRLGASLACADYRGYGLSDGHPSLSALVRDAHPVFDALLRLLRERGHNGTVIVMGRSLGSAPAIELAASRGNELGGLIIESGFARTTPLLALFGLSPSDFGLSGAPWRDNEDKMRQVSIPLLLLHAEGDTLLPPWNAERNLGQAASVRKRLVMIPHADHNTIIGGGGGLYWRAIAEFLALVSSPPTA